MGAHYTSLFLRYRRLSVPFATVYFNPMNNCLSKYEIHLYSFSSLASPSSSKFNLIRGDLEKKKNLYPSRIEIVDCYLWMKKEKSKRIIKRNNRWMQFSSEPIFLTSPQVPSFSLKWIENVIFTLRSHTRAAIFSAVFYFQVYIDANTLKFIMCLHSTMKADKLLTSSI